MSGGKEFSGKGEVLTVEVLRARMMAAARGEKECPESPALMELRAELEREKDEGREDDG